jgi:hypothetical protein
MLLLVPARGQSALSVTVTTDKQSYALGQTILIAISVQQFGAPVASVVVFYELRGPQNQAIANGFGITDSTGKCTIPVTVANNIPLGSYTVFVSVSANGQTASASSAFQTVPEFTSSLGLMMAQTFALLIAIIMLTLCRRRKPAEQSTNNLSRAYDIH